jgi:hypothetical protein
VLALILWRKSGVQPALVGMSGKALSGEARTGLLGIWGYSRRQYLVDWRKSGGCPRPARIETLMLGKALSGENRLEDAFLNRTWS